MLGYLFFFFKTQTSSYLLQKVNCSGYVFVFNPNSIVDKQ